MKDYIFKYFNIDPSIFKDPELQEIFKDKNQEDENIIKDEEESIKVLLCPCYKSNEKLTKTKYLDNGIIGQGHNSYIVEEYFICKECGNMYVDIKNLI